MKHRVISSWAVMGMVALSLGLSGWVGRWEGGAEFAQVQGAQEGASHEAVFAWFDTLGYPDVKGKAFVRLETGWSQSAGGEKVPTYRYGWVLKQEGADAFDLVGVDLFTDRYPPAGSPDWKVPVEKADFAPLARQWLEAQGRADKQTDGMAQALRGWGARLSLAAQAVFLARAAALEGDDALSRDLYAYAAGLKIPKDNKGDVPSFKQTLLDEFAVNRMWDTLIAFGERRLSHEQLLGRMNGIVKNYPGSLVSEQATEMQKVLTRMAGEEKARAKEEPRDLAKMTPDARARELIYQLRGQSAGPFDQPGRVDIYSDARREGSAAHQLQVMGFDAVPALIDAMDDDSLTHSVTSHRDYYFSHHVVRVGDAAHAILRQISKRSFYSPSHTNGAMIKDGKAGEAKRDALGWWAQVKGKGIKQVLTEAVERGDDQSVEQCEELIARYPKEALGSIQKGYQRADKQWVREGFLSLAGKIRTPEAKAWLTEMMERGAELPERIAAARGLLEQDPRRAVDAMIKMWETYGDNDPEGLTKLAHFLGVARDVAALEALGRGMDRLEAHSRDQALRWPSGSFTNEDAQLPTSAMGKAVEAFWINRLDDMDRSSGTGTRGSAWFHFARLGDMAAIELSQTWPGKYRFDHDGTLLKRDQDRTAMMNIWLKENGKAERAMPRVVVVERLGAEEMGPLIRRVVSGKSDDERAQGVEAIEAKGLGGLSELEKAIAGLDVKDPARAALEQAATRVSQMIREVVMAPESAEPDAELGRMIKGLKGQVLTAERLGELLDYVAMHYKEGTPGICLVATRDAAGEGFLVWVRLDRRLLRKEKTECWDTRTYVEANGKPITGGGGSQSIEDKRVASRDRDLARAMEIAFKAGWDARVTVICGIKLRYERKWGF